LSTSIEKSQLPLKNRFAPAAAHWLTFRV